MFIKRAGIFLITIFVVLVIAEFVTRIIFSYVSCYDMEMFKYARYGKVYVGGKINHKNKPNSYFKKLYGVEVKINAKGLRDYEYDYLKPPNCIRILILGDSMTFGWGVSLLETYSKVLEKKLNRGKNLKKINYQVINMGVGNYNLQDEVETLLQEGVKYSPDLIIIGNYINDAEIHTLPAKGYIRNNSYLYNFILSRWNILKVYRDPLQNYINTYCSLYQEKSLTKNNYDKYLDTLRVFSISKKIPVIFMIIPDLRELKRYPFKENIRYLNNKYKYERYIKVYDLLHYFDPMIDPSHYWVSFEDAHPNAVAHQIIAEALYKYIQND